MMKKELIEKYKDLMKEAIDCRDTEIAHVNADSLLCELLEELGFFEIIELYNQVGKWYS